MSSITDGILDFSESKLNKYESKVMMQNNMSRLYGSENIQQIFSIISPSYVLKLIQLM